MDPYGDPWGMPFPYYAQVGPFQAPLAPPAAGPFDGTLVSLPCVNPDWLRIMLGALDTMRNPSSWAPVTESSLALVLQQVDELKGQLSMAPPCCNVQLRLNSACVLQYSTDGGTTWSDTIDWAANFPGCVRADIPAPPTNPRGIPPDQETCNLAGFIAAEIIQGSITTIVNGIDASLQELAIAQNVAIYLAQYGFVWTGGFVTAFHDLYQLISSGTLSHFTFAETDPVLKSELTCAIFSAIRSAGAVTPGNFGGLVGNVCAISYTYPDVISAICAYVTQLGATGLQALQAPGALVDEDCSACGSSWCIEWPAVGTSAPWVNYDTGATFDGTQWHSVVDSEPREGLQIQCNFSPRVVNHIAVDFTTLGSASGQPRRIVGFSGGVVVGSGSGPSGPLPDCTSGVGWAPGITLDRIVIQLFNGIGDTHPITTCGIHIDGLGTNPLGPNTC